MGIIHGDSLAVMRGMESASVDLVYLDPPFCTGRVFGEGAMSFDDRWSWSPELGRAAHTRTVAALFGLLGPAPLMAYLAFMSQRLVELHRLLRETGTLYLHVDPTASHYLKVLLDGIFGADRFRNEVVWRYRRWPTKSSCFQRMHDTILVYGRGPSPTFHTLYGYEELAESTRASFGTRKQKADFSSGRRKPSVETGESQGPPLSDVWDVSLLAPIAKERTGYPTQKPERLLERVILASSNPGDTVLDPFCGSGTTLAVAERLGRKAIGIDQNPAAVSIASSRIA